MRKETPFYFELECEVFEKASPDGKERRIGGLVSTDHLDRQQETLIQEGLDFSPFLKGGYFNDNHTKDTDGVIGYPEMCELRSLPDGRQGWYVEGHLLKTDRANRVWDLAQELQRSGSGRKLGFSVEGAILERDPDDPKTVRKAVVREVAITKCPVNDKASMSVLAKSLSAGSGGPGSGSGVPGAMAPISRESLEAQIAPRPEAEEDEKKKRKKRMRKSDAVAFLMGRNPGVTHDLAERIYNYTLRWHSAV